VNNSTKLLDNFSLETSQIPGKPRKIPWEELREGAGYTEGFAQATNRVSILIISTFIGLTVNLIAGTLLDHEIKLPYLSEEKSDNLLISIHEFSFYFGYGTASILFIVHMMGAGEFNWKVVK